MSATCRSCGIGRIIRSTRDFRVGWCSHCFAIDLPKSPPRGKDKLCPKCKAGLKFEYDEAVTPAGRVVYNLRTECGECGFVKGWPEDCYFCGAEEQLYDVRVTEVTYRGKPTHSRDALVVCEPCLPKVEASLYDTQVDRVTYARTPVDPARCYHCRVDDPALKERIALNATRGSTDLLAQLLCPRCASRARSLGL